MYRCVPSDDASYKEIMRGTREYTINDFSLGQNELLTNETLFHNSNGYIGIRGCFEEGYPEDLVSIRGEYINAFYDYTDMKQAEKLYGLVEDKQTIVNVADTQSIKAILDGEMFSMFHGRVISSRRTIDMDAGVTIRTVDWLSPEGKHTRIEIKRMTSFVRRNLFLIEYSVIPLNYSGKLQFITTHNGMVTNYSDTNDPRVADESLQYLYIKSILIDNDISYITSETLKSKLSLCSAVMHRTDIPQAVNYYQAAEGCVNGNIMGEMKQGEKYTLYQYSCFTDSVRNTDYSEYCGQLINGLKDIPVESLYREQKDYLERFWKNSSIDIEGDRELDLAITYNIYQLLQSIGKDEYSNISAKGLSGEGYEGHFFWDTEMYILPCMLLTNPEYARASLAYRYKTLPYAKKNARLLGHKKGALYPWRTINGIECSGYFPSGTAQYHISGDIAYAVIQYYLATKDMDFIREMGAEIILETARLWLDTGVYSEGRFEIHEVTGPDEYTCLVNNNYYTNALAKYNMEWAVKIIRLLEGSGAKELMKRLELTEAELEEITQAADRMYLPYDEKLGINPQDDSFLHKKKWNVEKTPRKDFPLLLHYHPLTLYRYQVCKQADTVLSHFILEDYQSKETIRKSFEYYEEITTHDSSLSTCIFSIIASRLGQLEKAYRYFGDSAKLDLFNTHQNTKDGIHTANMGGNYMAIVYGFAGIRIKEKGLFCAPALPKEWKGYRFVITYENSRIMVEVTDGKCVLSLLEGKPVDIILYGEEKKVEDRITVSLLK